MNNLEALVILSADNDFSQEELEECVESKVFELRNFLLSHPVALPLLSNKLKYLHKIISACEQLKLITNKNFNRPVVNPANFLQSENFYDLYMQYLERLQVVKLEVSNSILPLQLNSSLGKLMDLQKEFERIHVALFQQNSDAIYFFDNIFYLDFSAIKISHTTDHFFIKNSIAEDGLLKNCSPDLLKWEHFSKSIQTDLASEYARIIKSNQLMGKQV